MLCLNKNLSSNSEEFREIHKINFIKSCVYEGISARHPEVCKCNNESPDHRLPTTAWWSVPVPTVMTAANQKKSLSASAQVDGA